MYPISYQCTVLVLTRENLYLISRQDHANHYMKLSLAYRLVLLSNANK